MSTAFKEQLANGYKTKAWRDTLNFLSGRASDEYATMYFINPPSSVNEQGYRQGLIEAFTFASKAIAAEIESREAKPVED